MTSSIHGLMVNAGNDIYYDPDFRSTVETYLPYLREHKDTQILAVNADDAYRYEGDFYGLLMTLKVPPQYHWTIMRVNNYSASTDLTSIITGILIPAIEQMDGIVRQYKVTHKIS